MSPNRADRFFALKLLIERIFEAPVHLYVYVCEASKQSELENLEEMLKCECALFSVYIRGGTQL